MAKKSKVDNSTQKILDYWERPPEAGEPVGCVCSSYTFHSDLFEEECLARFLGIDSDAKEEADFYQIELDSKLAQMGQAVVFVDAKHSNGAKSPRWSLIPVHIPRAAFHPKMQLLIWENHIRLIIGSANITSDGYRYNNELFLCFDFKDDAEASYSFLSEAIDFLLSVSEIANTSKEIKFQVQNLLRRSREMVKSWNLQPATFKYHFIGILPKKQSAFEQMTKLKPGSANFDAAIVESPSFENPGTKNEAAIAVWDYLKKRGDATVTYRIRGKTVEATKEIELYAPEELITSKPTRDATTVEVQIVDEIIAEQIRPLHSKFIELRDDRWSSILIGSSNFSSPGLGLESKKGRPTNAEANVLIIVDRNNEKDLDKHIDALVSEGTEVDFEGDYLIKWLPEKSPLESSIDDSSFPSFIEYIQYSKVNDNGRYQISLKHSETSFHIGIPSTGETIYTHELGESSIVVELGSAYPSAQLRIHWMSNQYDYPVHILSQGSIPPSDLLANLSLEEITNLLSTNLPLQKALKKLLLKNQKEKEIKHKEINDPHKRVDTSDFLLQKTRLFSTTLRALVSKIEDPVFVLENLTWRLRGPLGVFAIKNVLLKPFSKPEEKAFLLNEIIFELKSIQPKKVKGSISREVILAQVSTVIRELDDELKVSLTSASDTLRQYANECKRHYEQT